MIHDLVDRTNAKIWTLTKLRYAGASVPQLLQNYTLKIRSILEYASEVFGCVISAVQSKTLEDVQAKCLRIILGMKSRSYTANMTALKLERLEDRRNKKIEEFAIKSCRSLNHRWWFIPTPPSATPPRIAPQRFVLPRTPSSRAEKRPFFIYTKILNNITDKEWSDMVLPSPIYFASQPNCQLFALDNVLSFTENMAVSISQGAPTVDPLVPGQVHFEEGVGLGDIEVTNEELIGAGEVSPMIEKFDANNT